ncbi:DUF2953 domain-containing protein [Clostridium sp. BL-8]|uniref:DUF2953 domain-containing protein n=1 Tax=Clostridium sp. BL-8 TaxID=349938 RepID=UPI00098CC74F|nr:hypothetical protein CLOBL_46890 [Clostridium sp. BL-8]
MKLFFIVLAIIIFLLFMPIPIKIIIHYSPEDYYIKIYKLTIMSKKRPPKRDRPVVKKERKFFSNIYKNINYKYLLSNMYSLNLRFKPLLKLNFFFYYSLNDAARTAIFYGALCQVPPLIYIFLKFIFKINKFNLRINPIFEDKFSLRIESSSIIFLSFANIIYMTIIIFKKVLNQGR